MGVSGTGKSTSIKTLDPKETIVINVLGKRLPFKGSSKLYNKDNKNLFQIEDYNALIQMLKTIDKGAAYVKNVVVDDKNPIFSIKHYCMRHKINHNEILTLYKQGLNDNEIARQLGLSVNGVRYVRLNKLHLPRNVKDDTLTSEMKSIIVGTLLGDAWVGYVHKQCTCPKYQTVHCKAQEKYTLTIYKKLLSIMTNHVIHYKEKTISIRGKKCKVQSTLLIASRNIKSLIPYRQAFYPKGKKIIPVDFIKDKFTTESLAYWFMDDGSHDKNSNSFIFNTQCFEYANLQDFIEFLYNKFNLEFTIKKDKTLYLRHKCNDLFVNLIHDYITEDMKYKIVSSLNSVKQKNS